MNPVEVIKMEFCLIEAIRRELKLNEMELAEYIRKGNNAEKIRVIAETLLVLN